MGVKERKERDRADMRDMILQSAHKLFIDRGFEEVSIRNIAEAIEYSPRHNLPLLQRQKRHLLRTPHGSIQEVQLIHV